MASIDKIYGTQEQYHQLYDWLKKNHAKWIGYLYQDRDWWGDGKEHPISNFPGYVDYVLSRECQIGWVLNGIREQYGGTLPLIEDI